MTDGSDITFGPVAPLFATHDVEGWAAQYEALGFEIFQRGETFAYARRGHVQIHAVQVDRGNGPVRKSSIWVWVSDADALHAAWSKVQGGASTAPQDEPGQMRSASYRDPDGNLIRYGSRAGQAGKAPAPTEKSPAADRARTAPAAKPASPPAKAPAQRPQEPERATTSKPATPQAEPPSDPPATPPTAPPGVKSIPRPPGS